MFIFDAAVTKEILQDPVIEELFCSSLQFPERQEARLLPRASKQFVLPELGILFQETRNLAAKLPLIFYF